MNQATLVRPVEVTGVGLHTGAKVTARLLPHEEIGIVFSRVDLPGEPCVLASWRKVARTIHATLLQEGEASVSTVEHLLAALWALDITACRVELNAPEVPILDGSALPWCELLEQGGREQLPSSRPVWKLRTPVWVEADGGSVMSVPCDEFHVSCAVDFGVNFRQTCNVAVTPESFRRELAPARTFAREEWLPALRERGLIQGGSEENAIVLRDVGPSRSWRLENELARHKALDVVGDLALLTAPDGARLQAHFFALRAGHGLHRAWIEEAVRCEALAQTE
jgi:UDP-3-O-acyl N-acetylglucosamine deacetylase